MLFQVGGGSPTGLRSVGGAFGEPPAYFASEHVSDFEVAEKGG